MSGVVLQITDCHLFADPQAKLKGICTRDSLERVLAQLGREFSHALRLIVTGDLAHDERAETYQQLRELLRPWQPRVRLLPGNHDDRQEIVETFGRVPMKFVDPQALADRLCFVEQVGRWQMIGLDSQVPGALHGELGEPQLAWLTEQLAAASRVQPQIASVLFVHHPPVSVGSPWLDEIGLRDGDQLAEVLVRYSGVRAVCTGHVHQEFAGRIGGVPVYTTPSTSVQFRPRTEVLECDDLPPGFRVLELADEGSLTARVVRLDEEGS